MSEAIGLFEKVGEWFRGSTKEALLSPIKFGFEGAWEWFVSILPDIAGYGILTASAFMMISPLVSRGGLLKPLSYLAAGLTVTVCILATQ